MTSDIRRLEAADIPAVLAIAGAAGWNQTAADIEMLLRLAPEGCFGIECDGAIVATTTLLPLNDSIAWLGMVLTDAAYRRRGFARRLVERTLEHAEALGIPTVKLDATDAGRPLYLSVGFRDEQPVERWRGTLTQQRPGADTLPSGGTLLGELAARSEVFTGPAAYALVRPGARARYLGPFAAADAQAARTLIHGAFAPGRGDLFYWDVLPANPEAILLLRDLGFEPARSLTRMAYGREYREACENSVYAISGFELG